jgi:hypothetical protein
MNSDFTLQCRKIFYIIVGVVLTAVAPNAANQIYPWMHVKAVKFCKSNHCLCTQDIDLRCELLIKEQFSEECNFDVADAVKKIEKLRIVSRVSSLSIHENSMLQTEKEQKNLGRVFVSFNDACP